MKIILYKIMYARKLTIRQLSIMTGVPRSTIQTIMSEDSNPTIRTLEKLARGLGCKITDLYESELK